MTRFQIFFISISIFFSSLSLALDYGVKKGDLLHSVGNNVNLRDEEGPVLYLVKDKENLLYLGKKSEYLISAVIDEEQTEEYAYLVRARGIPLKNGQIDPKGVVQNIDGWVFGGFLKPNRYADKNQSQAQALEQCFINSRIPSYSSVNQKSTKLSAKLAQKLDQLFDKINDTTKSKTLYYKPVEENGCVGTLNEVCFENGVVKIETMTGGTLVINGNNPNFKSMGVGASKQDIAKFFGVVGAPEQNIWSYEGKYFHKYEADYGVNVDVGIRFFFNAQGLLEYLEISSAADETC